MLSIPEELIKKHAANANLPVVYNPCKADGHTKREDMKNWLKSLENFGPLGKELAFRALNREYLGLTKNKWSD